MHHRKQARSPRCRRAVAAAPEDWVEDNGAGIDWDAIAAKAHARGLPTGSPAQLQAALLGDGISSRDAVTATSGRGVGTSAVAQATAALGGHIEIDTRAGEGTCFRFCFPIAVAQAA